MAYRTRHIAPLWLGAVIANLQKQIIPDVKNGLTAVELHSAAWTNTNQSILTEMILESSVYHAEEDMIKGTDECRLLFLTGCDGHERAPS